MPLFGLIFLGLGWPWVGEFVGFIMIFIFVSQPNKNVVNRKHPITGVHNNQDQMWLAKIGKYIVFYVDLRS